MSKKWADMTKNEKLAALRADIATISHAIDKLTRRVDEAAPAVPKKAQKAIKKTPHKTLRQKAKATAADDDDDEVNVAALLADK